MNIFSFIKAKYRLFFGFCPKCNSSAPEIDSCNVCLSSRDYPPTQKQKDEMFKRFLLSGRLTKTHNENEITGRR